MQSLKNSRLQSPLRDRCDAISVALSLEGWYLLVMRQ